MNEKILIVDDEKNITDILAYALTREGYIIEKAHDGQDALNKVESFNPNIIILDLMIPIINGYDVCKKIENKNIGIIMLTAKNDIVDKILGLELGADDYLTKPFDIREVIARVKSLSRRFNKMNCGKDDKSIVKINNLIVNDKQKSVTIENNNIEFTAMEFQLLFLLLSNPSIAYSREKLLEIVWGMDYFGGTRTVDTHIQRIRKKLGSKYQCLIQTVHGIGYRGVSEVTYSE